VARPAREGNEPRLAALILAAVGVLVACSRAPAPPAPADDAATVDAGAPAADASHAADVEASAPAEAGAAAPEVPPAFLHAKLLAAHPIGHTSVVLKVRLEGGLVAAWKPDTRRGRDRYRGEVAARRLARALGLENVPPVELRAFSRSELLRTSDAAAQELVEREALVGPSGDVPGALVPWITGLTFPALEAEPKRGRWQKVLAGAAPVGLEGSMYFADISTLLVFDTLSGNWDRFSGGNVGFVPPEPGRDAPLLFIDNDAAFLAHPPPDGLARNTKHLAATKRFSRAFVARVRAFDERTLEAVFGRDLSGNPLLSAPAVAGVRARLGEVRRAFDAAGPEGCAAFP